LKFKNDKIFIEFEMFLQSGTKKHKRFQIEKLNKLIIS
jgi:hypothetical protein